MLLLNVIFWVGLLPMVPALPMFHSCEADDCRIGTAVGAGYCGTVTSMGGAITCAVSFGLECEVAVGVGGICATAGAMGDAACGKCESKSYPEHMRNFKLLSQKIEDIKMEKGDQIRWFQQLWANDKKQLLNLLKQSLQEGQNHIIGNELEQFEALQKLELGQEIIVEFQFKNLGWFQQLDSNDQNILKNQASLISLQENILFKVLPATDKISMQIDKDQFLKNTVHKLANIKLYFTRLTRGKGDLIIINDHRATSFRKIALNHHDGLESNIDNMFSMLQGGGLLNTRSIYENLGNEYCKPEAHQYFIELQYESFLLYSIALAMEGHSVSPQVINSFKKNLVSSTSSYIRNCGCPDNFKKSRRGEVSKLLQNLPESRESVIQNFLKVVSIENKNTRIKIGRILELENIEVNADSIKIVEGHPWEDIEILAQFTKNGKSEDLEIHNFAEICIDRDKNMDKNDACEILWTGPSPSPTFALPPPCQTHEMPDLNPVSSDYEVTDPDIDKYKSVFQEVEGNVYGCNHLECKRYIPEENIWRTITGTKFLTERVAAAGTLVGDKWVVQGGLFVYGENGDNEEYGEYAMVLTAEVWTPGTENWVEAPEFKSPLPVYGHCLVTLKNKQVMQIGGSMFVSSSFSISGGPSVNEGNVFLNGAPICDDEWDDTNARVFCRTMGYQSGTATTESKYGLVASDFSMDNVKCTGNEHNLLDCPHNEEDDCGESEGAGVICTGGSNGEQVCEGHNFDKERCESIGCCHYDYGRCWSSVGTGSCLRGSGISTTSSTSRCFLDGKEVASLKSARNSHACAVFQDQVWVVGGYMDGDYNAVEIYDPVTDTWREGPKRPDTREDGAPKLVEYSGQLFYIGGDEIGKIFKLNRNRDDWEEVADIEKGQKLAAVVMKKPC